MTRGRAFRGARPVKARAYRVAAKTAEAAIASEDRATIGVYVKQLGGGRGAPELCRLYQSAALLKRPRAVAWIYAARVASTPAIPFECIDECAVASLTEENSAAALECWREVGLLPEHSYSELHTWILRRAVRGGWPEATARMLRTLPDASLTAQEQLLDLARAATIECALDPRAARRREVAARVGESGVAHGCGVAVAWIATMDRQFWLASRVAAALGPLDRRDYLDRLAHHGAPYVAEYSELEWLAPLGPQLTRGHFGAMLTAGFTLGALTALKLGAVRTTASACRAILASMWIYDRWRDLPILKSFYPAPELDLRFIVTALVHNFDHHEMCDAWGLAYDFGPVALAHLGLESLTRCVRLGGGVPAESEFGAGRDPLAEVDDALVRLSLHWPRLRVAPTLRGRLSARVRLVSLAVHRGLRAARAASASPARFARMIVAWV